MANLRRLGKALLRKCPPGRGRKNSIVDSNLSKGPSKGFQEGESIRGVRYPWKPVNAAKSEAHRVW